MCRRTVRYDFDIFFVPFWFSDLHCLLSEMSRSWLQRCKIVDFFFHPNLLVINFLSSIDHITYMIDVNRLSISFVSNPKTCHSWCYNFLPVCWVKWRGSGWQPLMSSCCKWWGTYNTVLWWKNHSCKKDGWWVEAIRVAEQIENMNKTL